MTDIALSTDAEIQRQEFQAKQRIARRWTLVYVYRVAILVFSLGGWELAA